MFSFWKRCISDNDHTAFVNQTVDAADADWDTDLFKPGKTLITSKMLFTQKAFCFQFISEIEIY